LDFFVGLTPHEAGTSIGPLMIARLQGAAVYVLGRACHAPKT